jgi:hypothetical protein
MKACALVCSDVHLSHRPPRMRACEDDWYGCQRAVLRQVLELARTYRETPLPVLIAGDIFDHWSEPVELLNFAIDLFGAYTLEDGSPMVHVIPGQHDLPNHRLDQEHRGLYGALVRSTAVVGLEGVDAGGVGRGYRVACPDVNLWVYAFPWNAKIDAQKMPNRGDLRLALVHKYIYMDEKTSYPGASESGRIGGALAEALQWFDVAVFGDNHIPFQTKLPSGAFVFNNGTLMRRKQNELKYRPRFGMVYPDGNVESVDVTTVADSYDTIEVIERPDAIDFSRFTGDLKGMAADKIDYRDAVSRRMEELNTSQEVKEHVFRAIEAG